MPRWCRLGPGFPAFALAAALLVPARAEPSLVATDAPSCAGPADFTHFNRPLGHLSGRIALGGPVTIVAIGSSSTAGAGASSSAATYPSRLEFQLRARFPGVAITVLNRGVGGEEIGNMLARLDHDVIAEKPDLVLWQLGTNSVLRDYDTTSFPMLIQEGLARLKAAGADVVLIDPQFAPKVIAKGAAEPTVQMISAAAKEGSVELFRRFAVMRYWHDAKQIPFETFLSPDGLHMNDWSYDCVAKLLADAIVAGATRAPQTAVVGRPTVHP